MEGDCAAGTGLPAGASPAHPQVDQRGTSQPHASPVGPVPLQRGTLLAAAQGQPIILRGLSPGAALTAQARLLLRLRREPGGIPKPARASPLRQGRRFASAGSPGAAEPKAPMPHLRVQPDAGPVPQRAGGQQQSSPVDSAQSGAQPLRPRVYAGKPGAGQRVQGFDRRRQKLQQWSSKEEQPMHVEVKQPSKRKHKKSLSVCDESEYKQFEYIFNHPVEGKSKNHQPKKQELDYEQDEEIQLIRQCCERKGSTSLEKEQISSSKSLYNQLPFLPPIFPFIPMLRGQYSADYRLIHSQRNFSTHSISPSKVEDPNRRYTGRLKFFDEVKNYGFIVMDDDGSDIFVHYDDLEKANIDKDFMRSTKHGHIIRFEFTCMEYTGKYNRSRKAVNLVLQSSGFPPF